jgi:hypothetical protein
MFKSMELDHAGLYQSGEILDSPQRNGEDKRN